MEEPSSEVIYPTLAQIIQTNRRMIDASGGYFVPPNNLMNRGPLEYIIQAIRFPILGRELFPSIEQKAAALAFEIIASHVFWDGNKRTGIHSAWIFLRSNKVAFFLDETVESIAVDIASRKASRDDLLFWLANHIKQMDSD